MAVNEILTSAPRPAALGNELDKSHRQKTVTIESLSTKIETEYKKRSFLVDQQRRFPDTRKQSFNACD